MFKPRCGDNHSGADLNRKLALPDPFEAATRSRRPADLSQMVAVRSLASDPRPLEELALAGSVPL